eukprot:1141629-Pelagomonas_calceolata.AAC.3
MPIMAPAGRKHTRECHTQKPVHRILTLDRERQETRCKDMCHQAGTVSCENSMGASLPNVTSASTLPTIVPRAHGMDQGSTSAEGGAHASLQLVVSWRACLRGDGSCKGNAIPKRKWEARIAFSLQLSARVELTCWGGVDGHVVGGVVQEFGAHIALNIVAIIVTPPAASKGRRCSKFGWHLWLLTRSIQGMHRQALPPALPRNPGLRSQTQEQTFFTEDTLHPA